MEKSERELRLGEWQILKDGIDEFTEWLRNNRAVDGDWSVSTFGYGSPRCYSLIVTFENHWSAIYKVIRIDVRSGDSYYWRRTFDDKRWRVRQI